MKTEKKQTAVEYRYNLYRLRFDLQEKGIKQPVTEGIKIGIIQEDPQNVNYLLGRTRNNEFIKQLETLNNVANAALEALNTAGSKEAAIAAAAKDMIRANDLEPLTRYHARIKKYIELFL